VAVAIAGTAAVVGVPRAVPPTELPEPTIHARELAGALRSDDQRARRWAERWKAGAIDRDVRVLGEAVGAFGLAEVDGGDAVRLAAQIAVKEAAYQAIARSPEDVLALRAHQTLAFVREAKAFERSGETSDDLLALAGVFHRSAEAFGWYDRAARRLVADEPVLRAHYKKRWNELTGLTGSAFALTRDEELALFRFVIAHPAVAHPALPRGAGPDARRARALADGVATNEMRLKKIRELAKLDPEYPGAFAEGVVLFQLGRFEHAAVAFERHLSAHPDGPWTLRARNHLKAALEAR
jgi:tetratricopeptide (TPR) repeat protein